MGACMPVSRLGSMQKGACVCRRPSGTECETSMHSVADLHRVIAAQYCCGSVAVKLLTHLAALLCLERESGSGAGEQTCDTNGLACFFTPAVFAGVDAENRLLDLLEQLALAVACAKFERVLFFDG